jgi:DNA (cytosine-5)-methyltransferase 1
VHASPPCQGFSRANRFGGVADAENKKLSYTFVRALKLFKPTTATFENVEGIFQTKHVRFLQNLVTQLIRLDYQVRVTVLDASNYGDAQKRRRVIMFASLKGWPIPPCPESKNGDGSNALALYRTVRDTIGDLESVPPSDGNGLVCLGEDRIVYNHQSTEALSSNLGASDRIKPDFPVPTILTTSRLVHYSKNRLLTVRETARLFGFPDLYQFFGRLGEQYQQLGNAVPVGLATAVAKSISAVYGKTQGSLNLKDEKDSRKTSF